MRHNFTPVLAIIAAAILAIPVGISAFQQLVFAQDVDGADFVAWRKMTHEFEKNVIKSIKETNTGPAPHLKELLQAYSQNVQRIFIGDPNVDQVKTLLQSYEQEVTRIFDSQPPEPNKQLIKEFKQLTHTFRTEVLDLAHEGFLEEPR